MFLIIDKNKVIIAMALSASLREDRIECDGYYLSNPPTLGATIVEVISIPEYVKPNAYIYSNGEYVQNPIYRDPEIDLKEKVQQLQTIVDSLIISALEV